MYEDYERSQQHGFQLVSRRFCSAAAACLPGVVLHYYMLAQKQMLGWLPSLLPLIPRGAEGVMLLEVLINCGLGQRKRARPSRLSVERKAKAILSSADVSQLYYLLCTW